MNEVKRDTGGAKSMSAGSELAFEEAWSFLSGKSSQEEHVQTRGDMRWCAMCGKLKVCEAGTQCERQEWREMRLRDGGADH
jgi:hypothetical protein